MEYLTLTGIIITLIIIDVVLDELIANQNLKKSNFHYNEMKLKIEKKFNKEVDQLFLVDNEIRIKFKCEEGMNDHKIIKYKYQNNKCILL